MPPPPAYRDDTDATSGRVLARHRTSVPRPLATPGDARRAGGPASRPTTGRCLHAFAAAVASACLTAAAVPKVVISGSRPSSRSAARSLWPDVAADDLTRTVGNPGAASPGSAHERPERPSRQVIALFVLADCGRSCFSAPPSHRSYERSYRWRPMPQAPVTYAAS